MGETEEGVCGVEEAIATTGVRCDWSGKGRFVAGEDAGGLFPTAHVADCQGFDVAEWGDVVGEKVVERCGSTGRVDLFCRDKSGIGFVDGSPVRQDLESEGCDVWEGLPKVGALEHDEVVAAKTGDVERVHVLES